MAMHPPLAEGEQPEPSIAGQSTGRKNEFTLSVGFFFDRIKLSA